MAELDELKKCDVCGFSTRTTPEDFATFGDWAHSHGITTHYFCLLLSTNLPQRGKDFHGILGFLIRDIRVEIQNGFHRVLLDFTKPDIPTKSFSPGDFSFKHSRCRYCQQPKASIACHKCKRYFHTFCGQRNDCLSQFIGEYRSYCHECVPLDDFQKKTKNDPPQKGSTSCYICKMAMPNYNPIDCIYAKCCGNGFVHRLCMRKYALSAGYYLACIWCHSKKFRNHVRKQGVFVPDRDAQWERERNAYADLHRGHKRCDMEICCCPKGRNYTTHKWNIIVCSLCGSFGVHNPMCIPGKEKQKQKVDDFKCDTCRNIEKSISNAKLDHSYGCEMDYTLYVNKMLAEVAAQPINETPLFSDDETDSSSMSTATTVLRRPSIVDPNISFAKPAVLKKEIEKKSQQKQPVATQTLNIDADHSSVSTSVDTTKDWVNIKGWPDFDSDGNCIGSCTLQINLNSPRFARKTVEDICADPLDLAITDDDKFERSTDKGIFKIIDEVIEKFIKEHQ